MSYRVQPLLDPSALSNIPTISSVYPEQSSFCQAFIP